MVCKQCGGITVYDTKDLRDQHEELVKFWMEKCKNQSCEELTELAAGSVMSFIHEAAVRTLESRGHRR